MTFWRIAVALLAGAALEVAAQAPVILPRASQFDLTSAINGESYRVLVSVPPGYEREKAYPALYVLEGNVYFATAAEAMARQSMYRNAAPALVIGIGYPTDDTAVVTTRRFQDLTPTVSKEPAEKRKTGGGGTFLRVLEEEIRPFVASRYKLDAMNQALWGHSIGGLMVLRVLFRSPDAFSTYIASSPSIWWDDHVLLKDEAGFSKATSSGGPTLRLLITSAGEEQYRGADPKLLAAAERTRMIDNATELATRLAKLGGRLSVQRHVFTGESHISVSHSSVAHSLRFAFPTK